MIERHTEIAIHQLLNLFAKGDLNMLDHLAENIDLRIDHYDDDADTSWQKCQNKADFISVLQRLSEEIFPKGTTILNLTSERLAQDWYITTFEQEFWYGLAKQDVFSRTFIVSHESDGKVDYFRENVTTLLYR